jgi:hypothetical protein
VWLQHPDSPEGRGALDRRRDLEAALERTLEGGFRNVQEETEQCVASGRYRAARERIEAFLDRTPREVLRRRAERERLRIESLARVACSRILAEARERVRKGDFETAARALESFRSDATPGLTDLCDRALTDLREERLRSEEYRAGAATRAREEEWVVRFRKELLPKLKERRYGEVLKLLEDARKTEPDSVLQDALDGDRAIVAAASEFWAAMLQTLRGRLNQEISLASVDGPPLAGRLVQLQDDHLILAASGETHPALLSRVHPDELFLLAIGSSLSETDGMSYLKAALFFFCEGRDAAARILLSTAREMKAEIEPFERAFRGGFLRATLTPPK